MKIDRRGFIAGAAALPSASFVLDGAVAAPKFDLRPTQLPIGTIVDSQDSTYGGIPHYRILCDGNYWLPLYIKNYYLQVRHFPILFSLIGYTYGRRDIHNSVYGPEGEFALPYFPGEKA